MSSASLSQTSFRQATFTHNQCGAVVSYDGSQIQIVSKDYVELSMPFRNVYDFEYKEFDIETKDSVNKKSYIFFGVNIYNHS